MMRPKDVLTNLKSHENMWDYSSYPLNKEEAEVCIAALETVLDIRSEIMQHDICEELGIEKEGEDG